MKIRLLRSARVTLPAGETVDVSPDQARYLMSVRLAEPAAIREKRETPEEKTAARKTTRKK